MPLCRTPVIIGVGDIVNRSQAVEDAREPLSLIEHAIQTALQDSQAKSIIRLQQRIDSIDVVACWTWPYGDLPGLLADKLGVQPKRKFCPDYHGGNQPAKLLDDAARRVAFGENDVAVVCGGEALASLGSCARHGQLPPPGWTKLDKDVTSVFSPTARDLAVGLGKPHGVGAPIHVYPLYENGFRAHRNQSIDANNVESAELYAKFAEVAANQQYAWNYGKPAKTKDMIKKAASQNRMICFPYPLLMNAFNNVNLAAACLLTHVDLAKELGVPQDRWIYPVGGAGTRDSYEFWERPNFYSSPSISRTLDACLEVSGMKSDDVDLYDFYSCFPIVPKLACHHLGLSITNPQKPITLLGGLTSFGGAGNNYSMHAMTEAVRRLRTENSKTALVLANGGMVTYQHAVCLSSTSRREAYPSQNPLDEVTKSDNVPQCISDASGAAIIETYTVAFNRHNKPARGHIVGRLKDNGKRFLANHGDQWTLEQLCSTIREPIGRSGRVEKDPKEQGRNIFMMDRIGNL